MTVWLSPDDVAERLGVSRRKAMALMLDMPHSVISGTQRKRVRVSEGNLDAWMAAKSTRTAAVITGCGGKCSKRIPRRQRDV